MKRNNILSNKKAMNAVTVGIIIVLAAAVIYLVFTGKLLGKMKLDESINLCRISVINQAQTKFKNWNPSGDTSPFFLNCNTRYVKFFNDRTEIGLTPEDTEPVEITYEGKNIKKYPELNPYIVNQVIAEEMRICFFEFAEGKQNVFDTGMTANGIKGIFYGSNVCYMCSEISFENIPEKDFDGFMDYIGKTYIKNEKNTYLEYFNQTSLSSLPWSAFIYSIDNNGDIRFNSKKRYNVMFMKQDYRLQRFLKDAAMNGPILPLAVKNLYNSWSTQKNSRDNNYYVYVINAEDKNKYCNVVPG
jgi:hypothetical protein